MKENTEALLLRIFVGESDKVDHVPLYEVLVREARRAGLAGATAWRGMLAYGPGSRIRSAKLLDLSADLPMIIEMADQEDAVKAFIPRVNELFELSNGGGLVTMEKVHILQYRSRKE